jgi:hypothetical protein
MANFTRLQTVGRCALFLVLLLVAGGTARADTVQILSQGSAADAGEFNSVGPNYCIPPVSVWESAPAGGCWVSYSLDTSPDIYNGSFVTFTQNFSLPFGSNTGSITVWADDTTGVYLDGGLVFPANFSLGGACANGPIGCTPSNGGVINLNGLSAGAHTLTFDAYQLAGDGYGLLYSGSVESVTTVPEPATITLLGIGGGFLILRRRRRVA